MITFLALPCAIVVGLGAAVAHAGNGPSAAFLIPTFAVLNTDWDIAGLPIVAGASLLFGVMLGTRLLSPILARKRAPKTAPALDLATRVSAVARLGQRALTGADTATLAEEAVTLVADNLDASLTVVLEAVPGQHDFSWRAVAGPAAVGAAVPENLRARLMGLAARTLRSCDPVVVEDLPVRSAQGLASCTAVTVGGREYPFGVLAMVREPGQRIARSDVDLLEAVANVLATAIERKRREEEQAFLAEASALLARSLDYDTTLASLAQLAIGRLCDWCLIDICDKDDSVRRVAMAHADPEKMRLAWDSSRQYEPQSVEGHSLAVVIQSQRSLLVPEFTDEMLEQASRNSEHLRLLRDGSLMSAMFVPLVVRGQSIGVLSLVSAESGRRYTPADLTLAEELAHRAALAVDHARLYREATVAVQERDQALAVAEVERGRLHSQFEQSPALIAILRGQEHTIAMVNGQMMKTLGHRPLVGRTVLQALPELVPQGIVMLMDQVWTTGQPFDGTEVRVKLDRTGDGSLIEGAFDLLFQPMRDAAGNIEGILVNAVDVTEKVEARRKLEVMAAEMSDLARRQAALAGIGRKLIAGFNLDELFAEATATVAMALGVQYSAIAELMPDGITLLVRAGVGWPLGTSGPTMTVDGSLTQAGFALTSERAVILSDVNAENRFSPATLLRDSGVVSGVTVIIPGEEGAYGILSVHACTQREYTQDEIDFMQAVASMLATAVEQKRNARRLATQNAITQVLADSDDAQEAIGQILQVLCEGLGWDLGQLWLVDEAAGVMRCATLYQAPGVEAAAFIAESKRMTPGPDPGATMVAAAWVSGEPVWIADITARIGYPRTETGAEAGLHTGFWFSLFLENKTYGVIECFTRRVWQPDAALWRTAKAIGQQIGQFLQRRHAEEAVRQLNAELEQRVAVRTAELAAANHELEAFAYSVSHDLRAPLRTIDGFGQALWEDCGEQLGADGQDYLRRIREAARRMTALIDDLLRLSRVVRSEMRHEQVDLSRLARAVAADLIRSAPDRKVAFDIAEGVVANGDDRLLRVVLENLLSNAWKFTHRKEHAHIAFGCAAMNDERVYYVTDNGVGFDMTYAGKLFTPFQRLHSATEFEGTGVGLATVQRVIHRHGGRVWAQSTVDQGAAFYFTW